MKTTSIKQKLAGLLTGLTLVSAISLFSLSCTAQSIWETSEVKGRTSVFISEKDGKDIRVRNRNYVDPRETRSQYDINRLDFSYVSLISYDPFLESFKKSFTPNRITQLATTNDCIYIVFNIDEKGQILGIYFILDKGTTILPEELEILERELLSKVKFVVIGKKVEDLIFYRVPFWTRFTDVQNGEIRDVRNSVNLKTRY